MYLRRIIAAVATLGLIAIAGPAFAAGPPYRVNIGTNTSGTYAKSASRVAGTPLTFIVGGSNLGCSNLTASGSASAGTAVNPVFIFSTITFSGCTFFGQAPTFTLLATPNFTGTGNATTSLETVTGRVANFSLRIAAGSFCRVDVTGYANATFNETNQRIIVNELASVGNLTVNNVVGCGGSIASGSKATLQATLQTAGAGGSVNLF